jgi:hypothetical protein
VARRLNWTFDTELGDDLRDKDRLVTDGHISGDGTGDGDEKWSSSTFTTTTKARTWDDFVHMCEIERDRQREAEGASRIVETWHVGNLAWALHRERPPTKAIGSQDESLVQKTHDAVQEHGHKSSVMFVHISVSTETSVRRRRQQHYSAGADANGVKEDNAARLPMTNEAQECQRLHEALDTQGLQEVSELATKLQIPLLVLDNDHDGESAIAHAGEKILRFITPS